MKTIKSKSLNFHNQFIQLLKSHFSQKDNRMFANPSILEPNYLEKRASEILKYATKNRSLRTLYENDKLIGFIARVPSLNPRVHRQQSIVYFYHRKNKEKTLSWMSKTINSIAHESPRNTDLAFSPRLENYFKGIHTKNIFQIRFEVLEGKTDEALKNLIEKKNPPKTLTHLGLNLNIRPITDPNEVKTMLLLQKKISKEHRRHTYFSHLDSQLEKDKTEYNTIISKKCGIIYGVYLKDKLMGFMVGFIMPTDKKNIKIGGLSFFLDKKIQGLGISKTGYYLILKFLKKNKVKSFYGGTSQPAIKSLGKIMKRKPQLIIYLKE